MNHKIHQVSKKKRNVLALQYTLTSNKKLPKKETKSSQIVKKKKKINQLKKTSKELEKPALKDKKESAVQESPKRVKDLPRKVTKEKSNPTKLEQQKSKKRPKKTKLKTPVEQKSSPKVQPKQGQKTTPNKAKTKVQKKSKQKPAKERKQFIKTLIPKKKMKTSLQESKPVQKAISQRKNIVSKFKLQTAQVLFQSIPKYPRILQKRKVEGIVVVQVMIAKNHQVKNLKIFQSCGNRKLDQEALKAAKKSKYLAQKNAKGVYEDSLHKLLFQFKL